MTNTEKYNKIFSELFSLAEDCDKAEYNKTFGWDSIGHMSLMTEIEDTFDVLLDPEDIIKFKSYNLGKEILAGYGVDI